ncbi:hypothetical protein V8C86DRAFT_2567701 [Haematococcus lacustris]
MHEAQACLAHSLGLRSKGDAPVARSAGQVHQHPPGHMPATAIKHLSLSIQPATSHQHWQYQSGSGKGNKHWWSFRNSITTPRHVNPKLLASRPAAAAACYTTQASGTPSTPGTSTIISIPATNPATNPGPAPANAPPRTRASRASACGQQHKPRTQPMAGAGHLSDQQRPAGIPCPLCLPCLPCGPPSALPPRQWVRSRHSPPSG